MSASLNFKNFLTSKRLGHKVCQVVICGYIFEEDFFIANSLLDEVKFDSDVFGLGSNYIIGGHVYCSPVITVNNRRTLLSEANF